MAAAAAAADAVVTSFEVPVNGDLTVVATALCAAAQPGCVVYLEGPIGAGKTTLVQVCARLLDVKEPVTSPTFALAHRYQGRVTVSHLDLYRLDAQPLRDPEDLQEYLADDAVSFVEWPEYGAAWLPPADVTVRIRTLDDAARRFDLSTAAS